MEDKIHQREKKRQRMTVHPERAAKDDRPEAHAHIQLQSRLFTKTDDDGVLPRLAVGIPVAEVIHDQ